MSGGPTGPDETSLTVEDIQAIFSKFQTTVKADPSCVESELLSFATLAANYLIHESTRQADFHWFCKSTTIASIATEATVTLTFEEDESQEGRLMKNFNSSLGHMLSKCAKCGRIYQTSLSSLISSWTSYHIDLDSVELALQRINQVNVARIEKSLIAAKIAKDADHDSQLKHLDLATIAVEAIFCSEFLKRPDMIKLLVQTGLFPSSYSIMKELGQFSFSPALLPLCYELENNIAPWARKTFGACTEHFKQWSKDYSDIVHSALFQVTKTEDLADWGWYVTAVIIDLIGNAEGSLDFIQTAIKGFDVRGTGGKGAFYFIRSLISHSDAVTKLDVIVASAAKVLQLHTKAGGNDYMWSAKVTSDDHEYFNIAISKVAVSWTSRLAQKLESWFGDKSVQSSIKTLISSLILSAPHLDASVASASVLTLYALSLPQKDTIGRPPVHSVDLLVREDLFILFIKNWDFFLSTIAMSLSGEHKSYIHLVPIVLEFAVMKSFPSSGNASNSSYLITILEKLSKFDLHTPQALLSILSGLNYIAYLDEINEIGSEMNSLQQALKHLLLAARQTGPLVDLQVNKLTKSGISALLMLVSVANDELSRLATDVFEQAFASSSHTDASYAMAHALPNMVLECCTRNVVRVQYQAFYRVMPRFFMSTRDVITPIMTLPVSSQDDDTLAQTKMVDEQYLVRCLGKIAILIHSVLNQFPTWRNIPAYKEAEILKPTLFFIKIVHFSQSYVDWVNQAVALMSDEPRSKLLIAYDVFLQSIGDFLYLSDAAPRTVAVTLLTKSLNLLSRYEVKVPQSLMTTILNIAAGKTRSALPVSQLIEILEASNVVSAAEVKTYASQYSVLQSQLANNAGQANGTSAIPSTLPQQTILPIETSTAMRLQLGTVPLRSNNQRSVTDFFKIVTKSDMPKPVAPRLTSQGVSPSAPAQLSMMEQVKHDLALRRVQPVMAGSSSQRVGQDTGEIHPARPAGFNTKRKEKEPQNGSSEAPKIKQDPSHESSSESEDSDVGTENGALIALGRTKRNIDNISRASAGGLPRTPPPTLQQLEARRMKQRLSVDASQLHKVVLSWDYFEESDYPTGFLRSNIQVPDTFKDVAHYMQVMEPLLQLEAWQALQRARIEADSDPFSLVIGKRTNVDDFIDVHVSMSKSYFTDNKLAEADIILLSYNGGSDSKSALYPRRNMPHVFAKVKEGSINTSKKDMVDLQLRTFRADSILPYVVPGRTLSALRVMSITTVEREFSALKALEYYDLRDDILNATPSTLKPPIEGKLTLYRENLKLNESQAKAVFQCTYSKGFTLIQGPPGTGKTKTILGIVGAYFSGGLGTKRIMICAPSNAAVDELLMRLSQGVLNESGETMKLKMVRLGRSEAMNDQIKGYSLEEQVKQSIKTSAEPVDNGFRDKLQNLNQKRQELREILSQGQETLSAEQVIETTREFESVGRQIYETNTLLNVQKERIDSARRERETEYRQIQKEVLSNAHVVCATLSGTAYGLLASLQLNFGTVIIDEAAQSVELSALIPLKYGAKRVILVGDPNQLPPTVLSKQAAQLKYEQSLFVRMFNQYKDRVCMLDTQFRMHPDIARFPSQQFYGGTLKNGPNMDLLTARPWHSDKLFSPFHFFHILGQQERTTSKSFRNETEVTVAIELVDELFSRFRDVDFTGKIGIISPYKQQVRDLRTRFIRKFGQGILSAIDFSSVDGFQGQEKDIIIFSCVRAESTVTSEGVGFLADIRRLNVAITRAKSSLWILGRSSVLANVPSWRSLINMANNIPGWVVPFVKPGDISRGNIKLDYHRPPRRPADPNSERSPAPAKKLRPNPKPSRRLDPVPSHSAATENDLFPRPAGDNDFTLSNRQESGNNTGTIIIPREVQENTRTELRITPPISERIEARISDSGYSRRKKDGGADVFLRARSNGKKR